MELAWLYWRESFVQCQGSNENSTKAGVVRVYVTISKILCKNYFIAEEGYTIDDTVELSLLLMAVKITVEMMIVIFDHSDKN